MFNSFELNEFLVTDITLHTVKIEISPLVQDAPHD